MNHIFWCCNERHKRQNIVSPLNRFNVAYLLFVYKSFCRIMNISHQVFHSPRMKKENKTVQVLTPFYCRLALLLCQQSRELIYGGANTQYASEICKFISTLCKTNNCKQCTEESTMCLKVSENCVESGKLKEAQILCEKARELCPKSFTINAS